MTTGKERKIPIEEKKKTRKTIPKRVKENVWKRWMGEEKFRQLCKLCNQVYIDPFNWECAHVEPFAISKDDSEENLRPTCFKCNREMGKRRMEDYCKSKKFDLEKAFPTKKMFFSSSSGEGSRCIVS